MARFMDVRSGFVGVTEAQLQEAHGRDLAIHGGCVMRQLLGVLALASAMLMTTIPTALAAGGSDQAQKEAAG